MRSWKKRPPNWRFPGARRAALSKQVKDFADDFLNRLPETKTYSAAGANSDALAIDGSATSLTELLKIYGREVASKGINAASGGHFGYIPGGGLYASALADFLAAVTNEYAGVYFASPGAAAMETELLGWLKKIFNFPESAVGNLTSGGSIATLIALAAARGDWILR